MAEAGRILSVGRFEFVVLFLGFTLLYVVVLLCFFLFRFSSVFFLLFLRQFFAFFFCAVCGGGAGGREGVWFSLTVRSGAPLFWVE